MDAIGLLRQLVYMPNASVVARRGRSSDSRRCGPRPEAIGPGRRVRRHGRRAGRRPRARHRKSRRSADRRDHALGTKKGLHIGRSHVDAGRRATARAGRVMASPRTAANIYQSGGRRSGHRPAANPSRRQPSSQGAPAPRVTGPRPRAVEPSISRSPFVSKNVAVFVDVANIFYAAKAAGADIDYVTLLKAAVAGRDFVRAYAYTGLDPGEREPAQLPLLPCPPRLQGREQGHPQVRRRQGQGQPRHRARRRHDEDGPKPRRRDRRQRRRRLRARHPRGPGDGRPRRSHQLPRQHQLGPDRGRRRLLRHHPARPRRSRVLALGPAGRRATKKTSR